MVKNKSQLSWCFKIVILFERILDRKCFTVDFGFNYRALIKNKSKWVPLIIAFSRVLLSSRWSHTVKNHCDQGSKSVKFTTFNNGSNSSHIRRKLGVFSTKSSFWADVFYAFLTIGFVAANDVEETSN